MNACLFATLVGITTILASPVSGQTPPPAEHPLFKAITGRWVGDGSLKTRDSGELEVHEEWVAAAEDGGGYRFAGTRKLGQETHEFSWLFLLNATSGAYECDYEQTGMDQPMRFEVSITETRVEVKSPLGGPGSELLITNSLDGNLLSGTVTHRDANGQEVSSGTVIHRRAE